MVRTNALQSSCRGRNHRNVSAGEGWVLLNEGGAGGVVEWRKNKKRKKEIQKKMRAVV